MKHLIAVALVVAVLLATPRLAAADHLVFAEGAVGEAIPVGDEGYEALTDPTATIGVRAGVLGAVDHTGARTTLVGLEVGTDYTAFREHDVFADASIVRVRIVAGVRAAIAWKRAIVFAHVAGGVDGTRAHLPYDVCDSPTVIGPAFEGGVGAGRRFGHVVVGGEVGYSAADHHDDQPGCAPFPAVVDVLDNRTQDIDLRLFAGVVF